MIQNIIITIKKKLRVVKMTQQTGIIYLLFALPGTRVVTGEFLWLKMINGQKKQQLNVQFCLSKTENIGQELFSKKQI